MSVFDYSAATEERGENLDDAHTERLDRYCDALGEDEDDSAARIRTEEAAAFWGDFL
jgi:hypothetical protein